MQLHGSQIPTTGEARFDLGHSRLHQLIGDLADVPDSALAPTLDALQRELTEHFAQEDAELIRLGKTENACHVDEHAAVLKSTSEVIAALALGNTTVVRRFAQAMGDWLPEHVQEMDLRLARQLFRHRTSGAPIQLTRRAAPRFTTHNLHSESVPC
jgi:hemerythrin-like metal-binding protein